MALGSLLPGKPCAPFGLTTMATVMGATGMIITASWGVADSRLVLAPVTFIWLYVGAVMVTIRMAMFLFLV